MADHHGFNANAYQDFLAELFNRQEAANLELDNLIGGINDDSNPDEFNITHARYLRLLQRTIFNPPPAAAGGGGGDDNDFFINYAI